MATRFVPLSLVVLFASGPSALFGQEFAPPAKPHLHLVRGGDADTLAEQVQKRFPDSRVVVLPAGSGKAILVRGEPAVIAKSAEILEHADRPARTIAVEIILAEITLKKDGDKDLPEPDLTGPTADVLAKLDALAKAGQVVGQQRIRLDTVEGQAVVSTNGGNKPVVTSVAGGGFGGRAGGGPAPVQRSVNYVQAGTTVRLTPWGDADGGVVVDLKVEDSRVKPAEGEDGIGVAVENASLTTRVRVPNGRAVAAQATRVDGKAGRTLSVFLVTARVAEPNRAGK